MSDKDLKSRCRGEKDIKILAERLDTVARKSKSFLKYHDADTYDELLGLLKNKDLLIAAAPVVVALDPTAMDKKVSTGLATEFAKRHASHWKLKGELEKEWVVVMSKRLRNAVHHRTSACKNRSSWALKLKAGGGDDDGDDGAEFGASEAPNKEKR